MQLTVSLFIYFINDITQLMLYFQPFYFINKQAIHQRERLYLPLSLLTILFPLPHNSIHFLTMVWVVKFNYSNWLKIINNNELSAWNVLGLLSFYRIICIKKIQFVRTTFRRKLQRNITYSPISLQVYLPTFLLIKSHDSNIGTIIFGIQTVECENKFTTHNTVFHVIAFEHCTL